MTTRTYSSAIDQTTDAGFRAWGSELASNLQTAGLVQTADTGQINWTTVTRASVNTDAGYEIYKLNDSLFATAPLYIRINYGSAGAANTQPRLTMIVGTSTNGAGTITGTATGTMSLVYSGPASVASTVTSYVTYICVKDGFFGLQFKTGAFTYNGNTNNSMFFALARSCDSTGAITTTGFQCLYTFSGVASGTSPKKLWQNAVKTTSPIAGTGQTQNVSFAPGGVTSSLTAAGNIQVYTIWMSVLDIRPSIMYCSYVIADISAFATFQTTLFGSTPHTYLPLGGFGVYPAADNAAGSDAGVTAYGLAMIWE